MKTKRNKRGFTLAELLIVVAIIGVLVGVSIPIFSAQLKKSRFGTNQANARSAKAAAVAAYLADDSVTGGTYNIQTGAFDTTTGADKATNTAAADINIAGWDVDTKLGGTDLSADVYNTWYVAVSEDGLTGIACE